MKLTDEQNIALLHVKDGAWVFTHYQARLLRQCQALGLVEIADSCPDADVRFHHGIYAALTDAGREYLNLPLPDKIGRCDTCGLVDHHLDPETDLCPACKKIFGEISSGYRVGDAHPATKEDAA